MKAVINIEFFVSVAVFLSTIFFIIINIANGVPQFHNEAVLSSLRSKSMAASQVLFFDEGSPRNWNTLPLNGVNRFGLSTPKKYVVSQAKINSLATFCQNNYARVRSVLLGDDNVIIIINITDVETGAQLLYCSPVVATLVFPKSSVKRYAVIDTGNRISIQVDVT